MTIYEYELWIYCATFFFLDIEIILKSQQQQDEFINILRFKVEALEAILKNHIPDFERQYAEKLVVFEHHQKQRIKEILERQND